MFCFFGFFAMLFHKMPVKFLSRVFVREIWQTISNHPYLLHYKALHLGSCSKIFFGTFLMTFKCVLQQKLTSYLWFNLNVVFSLA